LRCRGLDRIFAHGLCPFRTLRWDYSQHKRIPRQRSRCAAAVA
jgi:hypothetical protein